MTDYLVCKAKNDEERDAFEKEALAGPMRETIDSGLIDYDVGKTEQRSKKLPLSFALLKTEEAAREWYEHHYPQYPDIVLDTMARALAIDRGVADNAHGSPQTKPTFNKEVKETVEQEEIEPTTPDQELQHF